MNYDGRIFEGRKNSSNGQVSQATRFTYHQRGERVWADYAGGQIVRGHLQGKVYSDGRLEFLYHHESVAGELMAGTCVSRPHYDDAGRLVLQERWRWFTGDQSSGDSEVVEITGERLSP